MTKKKTGYYRLRMISNQWYILKYDDKFAPDGQLGPYLDYDEAYAVSKASGLTNIDQSQISVKVPYAHKTPLF